MTSLFATSKAVRKPTWRRRKWGRFSSLFSGWRRNRMAKWQRIKLHSFWRASFPWNSLNVFKKHRTFWWVFTYRVERLSRLDFVYYESQAFVCKSRAFVHVICCCEEK